MFHGENYTSSGDSCQSLQHKSRGARYFWRYSSTSSVKWDSQDCRRGNRKSCCRAFCSNGFIRTGGSHYSCSQGPAGPISLKTVHWTVFRALDVPVPYSLFPVPCSLALYTLSCNAHSASRRNATDPWLTSLHILGTIEMIFACPVNRLWQSTIRRYVV